MLRTHPGRGLGAVATVLLLSACSGLAQDLVVRPDRPDGLYRAGERVRWQLEVPGGGSAPGELHYRIKRGGLNVASEGTVRLEGGKASIEATSAEPGWLLLEVDAQLPNGNLRKVLGGAVFSPERIRPAVEPPKDFDAFWSARIKELGRVPMNAEVTPGDSGRPGVEYSTITMDNIRGTRIHGQIARPSAPGKYPAMLVVQWAGVYPLEKGWAVDRAVDGWLVLNIQAHDLPVAEPASFYADQSNGPLRNYPAIGNDHRETSYFLRMYLSCYRGADYLASRPDWDGKVMVVTGGSQGGLQTLVTAALHPKITAGIACVPAGCDNDSLLADRAPGWPMWPYQAQGKDKAAVETAGRYYDVVNFAPKIKVPLLVGIGGIDTVCPPPGIYAALNQVAGPKEIVFMPRADHMGDHTAYYGRNAIWLDALKRGQAPPVK